MHLLEVGRTLLGFSDLSDGDLSFYHFSESENLDRWGNLEAVKKNAITKPKWVNQVHGNRLVVVETVEEDTCNQKADALITAFTEQPVGVFSADCLPVLLFNNQVCAAVHAGWKSTLQNIVSIAIKSFCNDFGQNPASINAMLGPCICQCCLEMGDEVYEEFAVTDISFLNSFKRMGKWHLDLHGLNRFQLLSAGLLEKNIREIGFCTFCNEEKYFSFRRQKQRNGSMFSFVVNRKKT